MSSLVAYETIPRTVRLWLEPGSVMSGGQIVFVRPIGGIRPIAIPTVSSRSHGYRGRRHSMFTDSPSTDPSTKVPREVVRMASGFGWVLLPVYSIVSLPPFVEGPHNSPAALSSVVNRRCQQPGRGHWQTKMNPVW